MGGIFSSVLNEDCSASCTSSNEIDDGDTQDNDIDTLGSPIEYFIQRFSLCILDIIRKIQLMPVYENGVEKCHIMEYLSRKNHNFLDGDLAEQVTTALIELESSGLIMHTINGYKTLGPFAKLCLAKNSKQRRMAWEKLEANLNGDANSTTDMVHPICPMKKARKI